MFQSARLKLTAWYLIIIMFISLSFSVAVYRILDLEFNRVERLQRLRIERRLLNPPLGSPTVGNVPPRSLTIDQDLIEETKNHVIFLLVMVNLGILGTSALAGYFLAGRTLEPIRKMVEEQNRFITDSSHELRTPLTSLKSEIEVTLRDKNLTLEEAQKVLKSNLEDVNNLQSLSDSLIRLTQYQEGKKHLTFAVLNLKDVLGEAVRKTAALAKNKNITVSESLADQALTGNAAALTELFVILLDNAVKYSPSKSKIKISTEKKDGKYAVSVSDEGIGIDEADRPHIFNRFFRTDKSRTKQKTPGYGLGLSIAKQIVENHRGTIQVRSKVGEGTTFTIELPIRS